MMEKRKITIKIAPIENILPKSERRLKKRGPRRSSKIFRERS